MHGDLRPWVIDTTNRKKFSELVKPANAGSPATCGELQKQLKNLFSDFPAEQKNLSDSPPTAKAVVRPAFYEIELPKPHDVFTQFYFHIITKEALRASNLLFQENEIHSNEIDIRYNAKQALKSIKRLIKKTADELRESGFTTFPDSNSEFKHFVLFTLKQMLSALFFEVQERYRNVLSEFETEESFCLTVLNENYSGIPQLKPTPTFFEFQIQHIISVNKFSESAAVDLLKQIQLLQNAKLQSLQTALENLVFLHSQNAEIANATLDQLTSHANATQHFSLAKKTAAAQIQKLQFGHERLEVVNTLLDELDEIQFTTANKNSIPHLLRKWLMEQKEIYTNRFSEKFPVITESDDAENKKENDSTKLSFGFTGDAEKLKSVLLQLKNKVELLNEEKTSADELFSVLTSKDLKANSTQIYIGCETVQFRYIIDKLSQHFNNLTPKLIEDTEIFFSKRKKKITAQNLYSNKIGNPKNKDTIDNILKHLQ